MTKAIHETTSEIAIAGEYDVVVCGGGMAGCGAAITAARQGAQVLLIERLEMLGGLGSAGWVGNFCAAEGGLRGQGRVFDEILAALYENDATGEENGWRVKHNRKYQRVNQTFDHRYLPLVLQQLVLDAGATILYATDIVGAENENGRIKSVMIHNRSLLQRIMGKVFIDTTGDGILSRHAGGAPLPDDPQFPGVIKPSNMMLMRKTERQIPPPEADPRCTDGSEPDYSVWPDVEGQAALKMKLFDRLLDTSTGQGYSDSVITMRREQPHFAAHFRRNHDPSYVYAGAAPMLGLRESSRIEGDHVLTIDECRAGQCFSDSVAYGTFTVDANRTAEILPPYQIPLRSLTVKKVDNCLVAGRCFSADRLALSSARTMATGCLMGQAAGIAAALAASTNRAIRQVDTADIRARLLDGAKDADLMDKRLRPKEEGNAESE